MALEPLSLGQPSTSGSMEVIPSMGRVLGTDSPCICLARGCFQLFHLESEEKVMLQHLFNQHKLVIADFERIALPGDYFKFWKNQFQDKDFSEYCTKMFVNTKIDGVELKEQPYYLLSDVLPIDYQLRMDLQTERLSKILEHQESERKDKNYERECLFCRTVPTGTRTDYLQHLLDKHNFYIAKLDNLIFTQDLIELLNAKLVGNVCIYCEKLFKDRVILKEHMRKKGHRKINPKNKEYDKFFISNYLEMGKNWQSYLKNVESQSSKKKMKKPNKVKDDKAYSSSESDTNWSDWDEKEDLNIVCLFCKHSHSQYSHILSHMLTEHNFDFLVLTENRNFYEKLKIVNFIRRQIFLSKCIKCDEQFENCETLLSHMTREKHYVIEDPKSWNQPEFYFPTYEDDGFLFSLEDDDDVDDACKKVDPCIKLESCHISQEVAMSAIN